MPGWGYMYFSNRTEIVSFVFGVSAPQLIVTTAEPTDITAISAVVGGTVTTVDGNYVSVQRGICWGLNPNPTFNDNYIEAENGIGNFSVFMDGLNLSTTYYFRAYAVTSSGTMYGEQKSFTTRNGIPTLITTVVTNIMGESAIGGGNITDDGGLNITIRGICWSLNPNPTIIDNYSTDGTGTGVFTSGIIDLTLNTTYYVRAYSINALGTFYGNELSFTTRNGIPELTTTDVTNIGNWWALCGGDITDDGGLYITERGICWSTSSNPTTADSHSNNGMDTGSYMVRMVILDPNTTYYVRAYAINSAGTTYGEEKAFTTIDTWIDGALPGSFSVNDSLQVRFLKVTCSTYQTLPIIGNLQTTSGIILVPKVAHLPILTEICSPGVQVAITLDQIAFGLRVRVQITMIIMSTVVTRVTFMTKQVWLTGVIIQLVMVEIKRINGVH